MIQVAERPFTPQRERPAPQTDDPFWIPESPGIPWQLQKSAPPPLLITISAKAGTGRATGGTTHIMRPTRWYGGLRPGTPLPDREPDAYVSFHELAHTMDKPETSAPAQAKSEERWTYMVKTLLITQIITIACAILMGFCLTNLTYLAISNHYHLNSIATVNLIIMAGFLLATAILSQKINLRNMKGVATSQK